MKDYQFLELAKKVSQKSSHHSHKIGCVITRKNRVLGTGFNMLKTHPKSPHFYKSCHAEFIAVLNSGFQVKGATVYVFRQQYDGTWANAKPCEYCADLLQRCGIKKVVYSFEGNFRSERVER